MLKSCPQCGSTFKTYYSKAIFCSKECHNASMVRARTYICAHCGTDFQRPNHVIKKSAELRFCSHACHTAWKVTHQRMATCVTCGQRFHATYEGQRACSKPCRDAALVSATMHSCETCGKPFRAFASEAKRGRRFCSHDCAEIATVGANHPNYKGGKWLKHGRRWQAIRLQVIERDKVCRWCGAERSRSGRALDVHHIKPRREYLIVDIANEMSNLVALCSSCHSKVEMWTKHGRAAEIPIDLRDRA